MKKNLSEIENPGKICIKNLKNDYEYQTDSIIIKTILKDSTGSIALFIIDTNQGLIEHAASSDAFVYILEGEIQFTISKQIYNVREGNVLKLPADIPHSLLAIEKAKMLLIIFA